MSKIKFDQLNYLNILISQYKELGLTENELIVLLLIDLYDKENPSLITGELLQGKMNLSSKEIDDIIVSLLEKKFVSYEMKDSLMVTSPKPMKEKVLNYFVNNIINSKSEEEQKVKDDEFQEVLKVLQDRLGRVLTPLEIDKVSSWFDDDIDKDLIIKVIDSLMAKRGKISSLNVIDKALVKEISHQDVLDEGFTSVDSTSKKNIKDALEIASYDWVKKDE